MAHVYCPAGNPVGCAGTGKRTGNTASLAVGFVLVLLLLPDALSFQSVPIEANDRPRPQQTQPLQPSPPETLLPASSIILPDFSPNRLDLFQRGGHLWPQQQSQREESSPLTVITPSAVYPAQEGEGHKTTTTTTTTSSPTSGSSSIVEVIGKGSDGAKDKDKANVTVSHSVSLVSVKFSLSRQQQQLDIATRRAKDDEEQESLHDHSDSFNKARPELPKGTNVVLADSVDASADLSTAATTATSGNGGGWQQRMLTEAPSPPLSSSSSSTSLNLTNDAAIVASSSTSSTKAAVEDDDLGKDETLSSPLPSLGAGEGNSSTESTSGTKERSEAGRRKESMQQGKFSKNAAKQRQRQAERAEQEQEVGNRESNFPLFAPTPAKEKGNEGKNHGEDKEGAKPLGQQQQQQQPQQQWENSQVLTEQLSPSPPTPTPTPFLKHDHSVAANSAKKDSVLSNESSPGEKRGQKTRSTLVNTIADPESGNERRPKYIGPPSTSVGERSASPSVVHRVIIRLAKNQNYSLVASSASGALPSLVSGQTFPHDSSSSTWPSDAAVVGPSSTSSPPRTSSSSSSSSPSSVNEDHEDIMYDVIAPGRVTSRRLETDREQAGSAPRPHQRGLHEPVNVTRAYDVNSEDGDGDFTRDSPADVEYINELLEQFNLSKQHSNSIHSSSSSASASSPAGDDIEDEEYTEFDRDESDEILRVYKQMHAKELQQQQQQQQQVEKGSQLSSSRQQRYNKIDPPERDRADGNRVRVEVELEEELELEETLLAETREPAGSAMDFSTVVGIVVGALLFLVLASVGFAAFVYHERYTNKPRTLDDCYANSDSGACLEDSLRGVSQIECVGFEIPKDTYSEEMYNLDNDSFLNSLEVMAVPSTSTSTSTSASVSQWPKFGTHSSGGSSNDSDV